MSVVAKEDILETIDSMTILELNELVKEIEKKFGVSAAAVTYSAVGGAASSIPVEEEKTEFSVILLEVGANKINVIKVVREITSLGLREAKELVERAPTAVIKEGLDKAAAEAIKKKLEDVGAKVEIK